MSYYYISDRCRGCGMCAKRCPVHAVRGAIGVQQRINYAKCLSCGKCQRICHFDAVDLLEGDAPLPDDASAPTQISAPVEPFAPDKKGNAPKEPISE